MQIIKVKLIVEDICNPSDGEAIQYAKEMINEIFGKEERQEYPRLKLILMEIKHDDGRDWS